MAAVPALSSLPNASIDFNALHDNAAAGKKDVLEGTFLTEPQLTAEEAALREQAKEAKTKAK